MGFQMPPILGLVGLVLSGVGLLFQIIGVATTGWIVVGSSESGLWKSCFNDVCGEYLDAFITSELEASRAFGILGVLLLVGCVVVGVLLFFMDNDILMLVAGVLGLVAGVCILIEFAVFADYTESTEYGYSFALTIIAFLLAIAAGICFLLAKFMGKK